MEQDVVGPQPGQSTQGETANAADRAWPGNVGKGVRGQALAGQLAPVHGTSEWS